MTEGTGTARQQQDWVLRTNPPNSEQQQRLERFQKIIGEAQNLAISISPSNAQLQRTLESLSLAAMYLDQALRPGTSSNG